MNIPPAISLGNIAEVQRLLGELLHIPDNNKLPIQDPLAILAKLFTNATIIRQGLSSDDVTLYDRIHIWFPCEEEAIEFKLKYVDERNV